MRHNLLTASLLLIGLSAFVVGGAAQKSQEEPKDQTTQGQSTPGMMGGGGMGRNEGRSQGTMGGGMMGNMGQMTTHHQQMSTLMSKLMDSMAAIQNEKDPAALQSKLAEHRALLDQMRGQMMQQGKMMEMMSGQVNANCGARGDAGKSGPQ